MPNIETIQAYVTLAKDIITGLAAIAAAYVAFVGLQTWKRQLTANAEYQLARRVLVAVYKVRDAINNCRIFASEMDSEVVDVTQKIHDSKFDKLDEEQASLDVELLEAEAVWGSEQDYQYCVVQFQAIIHTLKGAYSTYYAAYRLSEAFATKADAYSILFTKDVFSKDEFAIRLDNEVHDVENFLRPKLTLKQAKSKKDQSWRRFTKQSES